MRQPEIDESGFAERGFCPVCGSTIAMRQESSTAVPSKARRSQSV